MNQANLIELSAETLGKDVLQALIDELQATEWANKPLLDQEQTINRLRSKCTDLMQQGLTIMFSGAHPACIARIDSVTLKKGLKVGLKIDKGAVNWPSVCDAEGQNVLIVMADAEDYRRRMDEVKTRAAQTDMFTGEYKGTNEFRRDQEQVIPDKTWADVTGKPIEEMPPGGVNEETRQALEAIHVHVAVSKIGGWSERECAVALEWARAYAKWQADTDSGGASGEMPVRPWFIPLPAPPSPESLPAAETVAEISEETA